MHIDLNCDMGEMPRHIADGTQESLMRSITSVNIACGGHAGDASTMKTTIEQALRWDLTIGAHPGYPDRANFGRLELDMPLEAIEATVFEQVDALAGIAATFATGIVHVKPHGALYNQANRSPDLAAGIAAGIAAFDPGLLLVCQPGTELARAGTAAGLTVAHEGFADRAYNADGTLVSRAVEGSVYHDPGRAAEQALRMVAEGTVVAMDGTVVDVRVDTLCVHGDNPEAVRFVGTLRERLAAAGVEVRPLAEVVAARLG